MRSVKSEALGIAVVGALPLAIAFVFPYSAIGFRARHPRMPGPSVAFVELTDAEEADALNSARTLWRVDATSARRRFLRLPLTELVDDDPKIKVELPAVNEPAGGRHVEFNAGAWVPSMAADNPATRPPAQEKPKPAAFPREEMLKLN